MQIPVSLRTAATAANPLAVDHEAGTILGLSVIVAGQTRAAASGQGPMQVDGVTLRQVAAAINASKTGVKCRMTHPEVEGTDDITFRIGYIRNARLTPRAVLADFHAHDPGSSHVKTLLDIAETDPGSCGLSIVASRGSLEPSTNGLVLRVPAVDAVDFVGEPAANPAGMLAASAKSKDFPMTAITHAGPDATTAHRDAQDALLIRLGSPLVAFDDRGKVMLDATGNPRTRQPSREALSLASGTMIDIADAYLRRVGPEALRVELGRMPRPEMASLCMSRARLNRFFPHLPLSGRVMLAGSTGDVPDLLADVANKLVLSHFATARRSWRTWAKLGTVADFKQARRVRVEDPPPLERLYPGESVEYATLGDSPSETFALASYARGLVLTREMLINDDTEALRGAGEMLGQGAARLEDRLAYAVLAANPTMADGEALFSSAHANTATGTLSTASVGAAKAKLERRATNAGEIIGMRAEVMLVPTTIETTAAQLLASFDAAPRAEGEPRMRLVSSPVLDADSAAQWYVGTDPARMAAVEVSFRTGAEAPQIDEKSAFDTDGMKLKIRHDLAATAVDHRCMVRSSGS